MRFSFQEACAIVAKPNKTTVQGRGESLRTDFRRVPWHQHAWAHGTACPPPRGPSTSSATRHRHEPATDGCLALRR